MHKTRATGTEERVQQRQSATEALQEAEARALARHRDPHHLISPANLACASTKPPMKTIESYWPYATTIFDYVKRAMPFASPGSLSDDQVYAVTAFILSEAKIVPPDTVLNASTLAAVKMPNRDGFIPDPRPDKLPPIDKSPHKSLAIAPPTK